MSAGPGPSGSDLASLVSSGLFAGLFASQQQQQQRNGLQQQVCQSGPVHPPPRDSHAGQALHQQPTDPSEQLKALVRLLGLNGSSSSGHERGQAPPADRTSLGGAAPPEHPEAGSVRLANSGYQHVTPVELDTAALLSSLAGTNADPTHQQSAAAQALDASPLRYGGSRGGVGTPNVGAEDTAEDTDSEDLDTETGGSGGRGNRKRGLDGGGDAGEARRLKRMAKNRATAAASRERKKALLERLSARVVALETENRRLQQELLLKNLEGEVFRELLRTFSLTRRQPAGDNSNDGGAHKGGSGGGARTGGGAGNNDGCLS